MCKEGFPAAVGSDSSAWCGRLIHPHTHIFTHGCTHTHARAHAHAHTVPPFATGIRAHQLVCTSLFTRKKQAQWEHKGSEGYDRASSLDKHESFTAARIITQAWVSQMCRNCHFLGNGHYKNTKTLTWRSFYEEWRLKNTSKFFLAGPATSYEWCITLTEI